MNDTHGRSKARRQLLLIASIFLVPLAAAMWLYFSSGWRPEAGAHHGELIEPPRALPSEVLRGHWSIVLLQSGPCDPSCVASLEELGRVRLALDKDAARVRRVLLHDSDCCDAALPVFAEPDVLRLPDEAGTLRALFPPASGSSAAYIVDPHGNLVLGYAAAGSGRGMLKDLERLLRLSQIG